MLKITSIEGNSQKLDGGSMFGNAPRALWQKWTDVDELGRIPLACRCLLVEWQGLKILCETGIGAFFEPKLADRFGVQDPEEHKLITNLKNHGISPQEIDYVVLSHLHFDHAGGLLPSWKEISEGRNELVFSKAKILVGENAWHRALTPHSRDQASFIPKLNKLLDSSEQLVIINNNQPPTELSEILSFFESNGHTPGQMHTIIHGNSQDVVFAGDLIPGVPWVHAPITMGYDRFPELLIDEKLTLFKLFTDKKLQIFFTHDFNIALGELTKNEKGKYTVANTLSELKGLQI